MRQKVQSEDDAKLRKALENMRYKSCTEEDIEFLTTRVAGTPPDRPCLSDPKFRDVSIITAWNSQKDRINELGASRFAADHGQHLVDFFSDDKWACGGENKDRGNSAKKSKLSVQHGGKISQEDQEMLWSLSPHTSDHMAAQLQLCVGIPVMIRNNDATELCITKGQEGTVAGWQEGVGSKGQRVLETLFVQLVNPPSNVKIEGLPLNVVPISKTSRTVPVRLHDDTIRHVVREQVNVLLNFAMTDYASQGKTRPVNVVDLQHCSNHQSYYTCLSRSASAAGTVIMDAIDQRKITGGASGWLRQEFRMLELLDEITLLRYNEELPDSVLGHRRNILVDSYQKWKGKFYVPSRVPDKIRWSPSDPVEFNSKVDEIEWNVLDKKKFNEDLKRKGLESFVPAKGSKPVAVNLLGKRKSDIVNDEGPNSKKLKSSENEATLIKPSGLKWDSTNYSCAYDSVFTILFSLWMSSPQRWNKHLKGFSPYMDLLIKGFQHVYNGTSSLENVRDDVRSKLNSFNKTGFPYGPVGTSVSELVHTMLGIDNDPACWIRCPDCGAKVPIREKISHSYCPVVERETSTSNWLENKWCTRDAGIYHCTSCNISVDGQWQSDTPPKILMLDILDQNLAISHTICIRGNKLNTKLHLKGIIYYKDFHFTAIVIGNDGHLMYHDGVKSPVLTDTNQLLSTTPVPDLVNWDGQQACLVIYARSL
ncbi:hypothetical protein BJ138DRAFT_1016810 [Hygrophoropsis aurantiaca]|uniref:Uncharacterized protein n=1 Tax=Hygrophoropsis aurantiaca TaxID=72124 RepID=A0ACB7ZZ43_9AGAM|nr:hypothetical protein BJ138DRAFT_1016810 [Hygrophoropsis aurantiaca]